ncbi:MAG: hypothetical protein Ct9H300mP8_05020 [Gammaproteobacteria bacterium]|nr:MAG: hypothetical protein Ct9H300mP8_05020 [Gammaproteobacteria bacterium]
MNEQRPALSLAAVPGRRQRTLDLAREIEQRGFPGIYCPSLSDGLALCEALAFTTSEVRFGTSIQPIYTRNVQEFAQMASFIHEVSGGRFDFGVGVSHEPAMNRLGIKQGGNLWPICETLLKIFAPSPGWRISSHYLRDLAEKNDSTVGDPRQWNGVCQRARSHMETSLAVVSNQSRSNDDFFIGNMIPTCIHDDEEAAKAVNRRTLSSYAMLPNYRNYWKEAGYEEEMEAVEAALRKATSTRLLLVCPIVGF